MKDQWSKFDENYKATIQDVQTTPRRNIFLNKKRYLIMKFMKINDKEKILRLEKEILTHYL